MEEDTRREDLFIDKIRITLLGTVRSQVILILVQTEKSDNQLNTEQAEVLWCKNAPGTHAIFIAKIMLKLSLWSSLNSPPKDE